MEMSCGSNNSQSIGGSAPRILDIGYLTTPESNGLSVFDLNQGKGSVSSIQEGTMQNGI